MPSAKESGRRTDSYLNSPHVHTPTGMLLMVLCYLLSHVWPSSERLADDDDEEEDDRRSLS